MKKLLGLLVVVAIAGVSMGCGEEKKKDTKATANTGATEKKNGEEKPK